MAIGRGERRWSRVVWLIAVVGVGAWVGREWWIARQYRQAMEAIKAEIEDEHHALAARGLRSLAAWGPDTARTLYLLGYCERALGDREAAVAAWAQVPPSSRFAIAAVLGRMELDVERGRLADAERLIRQAMADPRMDPFELAMEFAPVYVKEGRADAARELIEAAWTTLDRTGRGATEPAILLVRLSVEIGSRPDPAAAIRSLLDRAGRLAPEDDRVWLGKANLAIRSGEPDEAGRWLDACLRRRPDDVDVWRARLDRAMASDRPEEADEAIRHLPAAGEPPARVRRRAAWLAARRGDREAERRALAEALIEDPAEFDARDRLIEMATRDGRPDLADELRGQEEGIRQLEARYQERYRRGQPTRDAEEMARLAGRLGRRFEARGWLTVAVAIDPSRDDLRADLARIERRAPG